MSVDALFSDAVARDVFAAGAPVRAAHLCCRCCGSDAPGTRECCLRVADRGAGGHAVGRTWTNFTVVCCRACYRRGVALSAARLAVLGWVVLAAVAAPVAFVAAVLAGAPAAERVAIAAGLIVAVAVPVLLYRAVARRQLVGLLGADRDARLRRRVGVAGWGVTTAVAFRRAVPAGEAGVSLDSV
jgi:hypothetical protein